MNHIDPYPISALSDRYKLKSKQAVYDRINALGIQPVARGKISSCQLDMLDELHEHIDAGGTIDDFVNGERERVGGQRICPPISRARAPFSFELAGIPVDSPVDNLPGITFIQLIHEIASALALRQNPIEHWFVLERAASANFLLSSKEVKQLIGVKPMGVSFTRGSFTFIKSGKIGSSTAWKVEKL